VLTITSCNVNGIRAAHRKGLLAWLGMTQPDILCLQETRCNPDELDAELREPHGYATFWEQSTRKGYSGVALFCRQAPKSVEAVKIDGAQYGEAGRVLKAEYDAFVLINVYVPSRENNRTWPQKHTFLQNLLVHIREMTVNTKPIIVCGDFNIAHQQQLDIQPPQARKRHVSLLNAETGWVNDLIACQFVDAFRWRYPDVEAYTWKQPNPTWRLDYIFVSESLCASVMDAWVHGEVGFSDHCAVSVTFDL
jgi:exodeoxyribonuclease-3